MKDDELIVIQSDAGLVADVRSMIAQTREGVARTVNAGMTLLYWRIGKRIQTEVLGNERAEYGKEIVQSLSAQLSWTHLQRIIPLKDDLQRDFYAEMCRIERWSTRTLVKKIDSMLYERTAISKKPEEVAKAELAALRSEDQLTPDLVFRDPYILDFPASRIATSKKTSKTPSCANSKHSSSNLATASPFLVVRRASRLIPTTSTSISFSTIAA